MDPILELCQTLRKRLYVLQEINPRLRTITTNLGLKSKTPSKNRVFVRESPVVVEIMKEIGSIDEHFALGGSARGAI